ncbi:MAG: hypothetical protein JWR68_2465 [Polaromonas sp.]|nr:hypothetical protein [Polaromonas sp.]
MPALPAPVRWLMIGLAVLSLALGIVGLFLPLLPTVPFLLLAAWAAGLGSPRLSRWLENHPQLGPLIRNWRQGGAVRRKTKWMATAVMALSASGTLVLLGGHWSGMAAVAVMAGVLAWLWCRPEPSAGTAGR